MAADDNDHPAKRLRADDTVADEDPIGGQWLLSLMVF